MDIEMCLIYILIARDNFTKSVKLPPRICTMH